MQVRGKRLAVLVSVAGAAAALTVSSVSLASSAPPKAGHADALKPPGTVAASFYRDDRTATPIKHLVVIFGENISFDHYFGTYPNAANTDGSPFYAKPGTPKVTNLQTPTGPGKNLLNANPNFLPPQRLSHSEALTCDQNHSYLPEQEAADNGAMDKFVQFTDHDTCTGQPILFGSPGLGMDYYDGNTATAMWNYAQNYAMSDNNFGTNYGPSTPGALNVISGNDGGGTSVSPTTGTPDADPGSVGSLDSSGIGTIYGDIDPAFDDCSDTSHTSTTPVGVMTGKNIGDLLNTRHITWGWFQGGFAPTTSAAGSSTGYAICGASHANIGGVPAADYSPHHEPFQYYASTANPQHLPPSSVLAVGRTDQANHQYDMTDFTSALQHGVMQAVSFLKAPEYQDGHAGYSDPLDEQAFLVNTINQIEKSRFWPSTAIVVTYDDSDGWYDQVKPPTVNGSDDTTLADTALCSSVAVTVGTRNDRCGFGMRMPFVVISPWTRQNYVSHTLINQASVVDFIEDNWLGGKRLGGGSFDAISGSLDAPGGVLDFRTFPHLVPVILNPSTGEVVSPWYDTGAHIKKLDGTKHGKTA